MTDQEGRLLDAVDSMLDTLSRMSDAQEHMQCAEAEVIAAVFRIAGRSDDADQFIEHHAYGDDGGEDEHHAMWHAVTDEPVPCRECEHDPSDDEIERRKDGS